MTPPASHSLLRIDASARLHDSHSRRLGDRIQAHWQQRHPQGRVVQRDLGQHPVPAISELTIQGYYTASEQLTPALRAATAVSDELIAELEAAGTLLIATPIYNYGAPASLKAWVDQVVRTGRTFAYTEAGPKGLLTGRKAVLALAYGLPGYEGGALQAMDHLRPYLLSVLDFMGISEVEVVSLEATAAGGDLAEASEAAARHRIDGLFAPVPMAA